MNLYSLRGLRQIFEGRAVLDIEVLELSSGVSYALLGPNGSGKTSLLHILAFLRPPVMGEVFFQGRKVDWREKALLGLRHKVVLVDQHPIMFTTTVLKNVEYGLRMRGVPFRERRKIAEKCLDRVGMWAFAHRPAHLLSGGETQRVAIARAMACGPEVMLFDEPTASVDVENEAVIDGIVQDLRKEKGISIVFATHKRLEATRLADERIFLFDGRLTGPGGENLFSCTFVQRDQGTVCVIGENIALPVSLAKSGVAPEPPPRSLSGPGRVFIKPDQITLSSIDKREDGMSLQDHVGEVVQMTAEGPNIKVLLDMGVTVRAVLSKEEIKRVRVMVGDRVRVVFGQGAVEPAV